MYEIDLEVQKKNWNCEGLPGVGDIINVFNSLGIRIRTNCRVDYIGDSLIICMDSDNEESCFNIRAYTFKPTSTPEETAKQKAIDEMLYYVPILLRSNTSSNGYAGDLTNALLGNLYDAGYTKSKVKPLSFDQYSFIARGFTDHKQDYKTLIKNGHCIGSAD
jgi:hypothetical protein